MGTLFVRFSHAMPTHRHHLTLETAAPLELLDLTEAIHQWVRTTGVRDGLLSVTSAHTTARLTINEREPRLQQDMVRFLTALAPPQAGYAHDSDTVDGRANAHAHLLGLLLNTTECIPVVDGALQLGTWQSLFLIELDGPRRARTVLLQLMEASP